MDDGDGKDRRGISFGELFPFLDDASQPAEFDLFHLRERYGAQHAGVDVFLSQKLRKLRFVSRRDAVVILLQTEVVVEDRSRNGMGRAPRRRHADLLALEIANGFNRRTVEYDDSRF